MFLQRIEISTQRKCLACVMREEKVENIYKDEKA